MQDVVRLIVHEVIPYFTVRNTVDAQKLTRDRLDRYSSIRDLCRIRSICVIVALQLCGVQVLNDVSSRVCNNIVGLLCRLSPSKKC
jgi:hypothetical protein